MWSVAKTPAGGHRKMTNENARAPTIVLLILYEFPDPSLE